MKVTDESNRPWGNYTVISNTPYYKLKESQLILDIKLVINIIIKDQKFGL